MTLADEKNKATEGAQQPTPPAITLPKGGGAIKGIDEKFSVNPATGTGSMTVPIATSPGRSGFGPQLSLAYDSGAGNGPFGFGWNLSIPSITRKTDKGLPRYRDAEESDVYVLSGAEDLVPVLAESDGEWQPEPVPPRTVDGVTYQIQHYRPRIEGLFARIERWTDQANGEIHWRSISKDNITTVYGKDNNSRIFDPNDPSFDPNDPQKPPTRIFSWLICQSYDDKGNAIVYEYAKENSHRIFEDDQGNQVALAHERNRTDDTRKANRYLKYIKYGNRLSTLDPDTGQRPPHLTAQQIKDAGWMFEVVFDYGEGHYAEEEPDAEERVYAQAWVGPPAGSQWPVRQDPFSSYRAGFEVRTYRLCRRVLMFHHFPAELGVDDYLVRATEFDYQEGPIASFINAVTQSGYVRQDERYLKGSLPPLEFEYTQADIHEEVQEIDAESVENLPVGLDGATYRWVDLDGEGVSGVLTEQADAWFYKPNLGGGRFGPLEPVAAQPSLADLKGGRQQLLDLAGDGQLDLAQFDGPTPGFYERGQDDGWAAFRPFVSLPVVDWADPNLRFVDLTGDGHADLLITEDGAFTWHLALAEAGFGQAERARQALDEEAGPRLVFADGTQREAIYLADFSGDGLVDLARVRNGEVCYWPNLGYGRFGAKVTMDDAPWFDAPDLFDQRRVRLADIDGTGTTDIIYLGHDTIDIYRNQVGNAWSQPERLTHFPLIDNLSSVTVVDLLGRGTACLVWSSPLPSANGRPMRYIDLMAGQRPGGKPHLLVKVVNNLGAETHITYAPSTQFYLADKEKGQPWITRLPFPVHVVERAETYDRISGNHFVARYAYHHGYYDGQEREFRGFGLVEQWDTEAYATLAASGRSEEISNLDEASHLPPAYAKTWFHSGIYLDRAHISRQFEGEYYREPGLDEEQARALLLPDTLLPDGLTVEEEREACRALKGSMLRQEVYAEDAPPDASEAQIQRAKTPYTVTEQNFTIRRTQPHGENRHAVFFAHPREALSYHYERHLVPILNGQVVDEATAAADPNTQWRPDPRISHALTLEVDDFGNVLKAAAVGYGRRREIPVFDEGGNPTVIPNPGLSELDPEDQAKQTATLITYTQNRFTVPENHPREEVSSVAIDKDDNYRTPLPCETSTYELRKPQQEQSAEGHPQLFRFEDILDCVTEAADGDHDIDYGDIDFTKAKEAAEDDPDEADKYFRRPIEQARTRYRRDDLAGPLPPGRAQALALPYESYQLAFTPGLLDAVYRPDDEDLLPEPARADVLGGRAGDQGGYVDLDGDGHWWIPSGRVFYSPDTHDDASNEVSHARQHFFLPFRYRDPFHTDENRIETIVTYDDHDLLMMETRDPLDNMVSVNTQDDKKNSGIRIDYRVLQPYWVTGPNGNRSRVAFDALGMVVGTAVMGKPGEGLGDSLDGFVPDLAEAEILDHLDNPLADPHSILDQATTRLVYDLFAYQRSKDGPDPQPAAVYSLARETHSSDLEQGEKTKIQHSFSYSDGFGREIQKKIQAEPEKINGVAGPARWVGSGWTVYNNKGQPVRQYEPFFSGLPPEDGHRFEFGVQVGVSPILFYDPVGRAVATLHPNHTWEKVVFDPWRQETWDVNDTVLQADPRADPDVGDFFRRLPEADWKPTWHALRTDPDYEAEAAEKWPDPATRETEAGAAEKAAAHADTPSVAHLDTLGRPFLTVAHNKVNCPNHDLDGTEDFFHTRVELDIEGNQRAVIDAKGRVVMRYDYDMAGPDENEETASGRIHQASMEAGERWVLNDITGQPIRAWDSRRFLRRMTYDELRRPTGLHVTENGAERLAERTVYGESQGDAANHRTRVYQIFDSAGIVTSVAYDFKGNLLESQRDLLPDYKQAVNWRPDSDANDGSFTSSTTYDALDRPLMLTAPDGSLIRPTYNEANLLEAVDANLRGEGWTPFVTNINYNAKGQRTLIDYGNGVRTTYEYDPPTFRLVHLLTRRDATDFPNDCPQPPLDGWPGCQVQNLHYTYDPVGNITHLRDEAQQTIVFKNQRVEPSAEYTYDAHYRLIEATGREHLGQNGQPLLHSHDDAGRVGLPHPGDGKAMGLYTERYLYDAVGNILEMQHRGRDSAHSGWTRTYVYDEPSLIENGTGGSLQKTSNRLTRTTVGSGPNRIIEEYTYDAHGNMTTMPHLPLMNWNHNDELQATSKQDVGEGGCTPETTYYVYDAGGQRARKVTERHAPPGHSPSRREERIYLGGFEIYRKYEGNGTTVTLERETLHIMDSPSRSEGGNQQRIALVETKTIENGNPVNTPRPLQRYQYGNHLGSASLELDGQARMISYEEYTPYGSTSYQAVDKALKAAAKRYRHTGKERDEESGLYYHVARYSAPWIGTWISCDPVGIAGGLNLYAFAGNSPIVYMDPNGTEETRAVEEELSKLSDKQLYDIYRFAGEQLDPGLGAYYLGARYYDPVLGRFLTIDRFPGAIQSHKSLHKYLYGENDPVNNLDPSGHFVGGVSGIFVTTSVAATLSSIARPKPAAATPLSSSRQVTMEIRWARTPNSGWTHDEAEKQINAAQEIMYNYNAFRILLVGEEKKISIKESSIRFRQDKIPGRTADEAWNWVRENVPDVKVKSTFTQVIFVKQIGDKGLKIAGLAACIERERKCVAGYNTVVIAGGKRANLLGVTLAHELGHSLSLGHNEADRNLMQKCLDYFGSFASPYSPEVTDIQKRKALCHGLAPRSGPRLQGGKMPSWCP